MSNCHRFSRGLWGLFWPPLLKNENKITRSKFWQKILEFARFFLWSSELFLLLKFGTTKSRPLFIIDIPEDFQSSKLSFSRFSKVFPLIFLASSPMQIAQLLRCASKVCMHHTDEITGLSFICLSCVPLLSHAKNQVFLWWVTLILLRSPLSEPAELIACFQSNFNSHSVRIVMSKMKWLFVVRSIL